MRKVVLKKFTKAAAPQVKAVAKGLKSKAVQIMKKKFGGFGKMTS